MEWNEIDLSAENPREECFASVGNGSMRLSNGACKLITNFKECNYVTFVRAKKSRVYFLGLKLSATKTANSIPFSKINDPVYGAIICSENVLHAFYGYEGIRKEYTKHIVTIDEDDKNVMVVYYNYKSAFYEVGSNKKIRTKHIGQIFNDVWLVESSKSKTEKTNYPVYFVRNINTNEIIEINSGTLIDIERGITSVENVIECRKTGKASWLGKRRAAKKKRLKAIDNIKRANS